MRLRGLIAAAVVLAALAATLYWTNRRQPAQDAARLKREGAVTILVLNQDDISGVDIKKKGEDHVVLSKVGPQNWKITSPRMLVADPNQVTSVLSALAPVQSDSVVEQKATDLKPYGLADPDVRVSVTTHDGKPHVLLIGDVLPTGGSAYAILEGDPRLFTISVSTKDSLEKDLKDMLDMQLLPVDYYKVGRVEITGPKLHIVFSPDSGQWAVQFPPDVRGDLFKLQDVIEQLRNATAGASTTAADMKEAGSLFEAGTPVATVEISDESGAQKLQVRKNKGAYYAKSSALDGVYKVSNELGDILSQNLDDFREKKLFEFSADNPDTVEMHYGTKAFGLAWTGADWYAGKKKLDPLDVEPLLMAIRALSATKFVTNGFSTPTITLAVTSMEGKRVEKVQISKYGNQYLAKRELEPALYVLDAKSVDDLVKAADELEQSKPKP